MASVGLALALIARSASFPPIDAGLHPLHVNACSPHQRWYKHIYTGHPLPDLYLQNTCKLAVKSPLVRRPIARRRPCAPPRPCSSTVRGCLRNAECSRFFTPSLALTLSADTDTMVPVCRNLFTLEESMDIGFIGVGNMG